MYIRVLHRAINTITSIHICVVARSGGAWHVMAIVVVPVVVEVVVALCAPKKKWLKSFTHSDVKVHALKQTDPIHSISQQSYSSHVSPQNHVMQSWKCYQSPPVWRIPKYQLVFLWFATRFLSVFSNSIKDWNQAYKPPNKIVQFDFEILPKNIFTNLNFWLFLHLS